MGLADRHTIGPDEPQIRERFGVPVDALLGSGGESRVFALDDERVLRIFHAGERPHDDRVARLLDHWRRVDIGLGLPIVLDAGREGRQDWSVDRRIPGHALTGFLRATRSDAERRAALLSMLDAAHRLRDLPLPLTGFRRVLDAEPREFGSLVDLLLHQADLGSRANWGALAARVPDLAGERERLFVELAERDVVPAFVHADVHPGNVLADLAGRVTGVCDITVHALAADPVLDEVGAVCMLPDYPERDADTRWLADALRERLGVRDAWLVDAYCRWYALYYSMDAGLLDWAAGWLGGADA